MDFDFVCAGRTCFSNVDRPRERKGRMDPCRVGGGQGSRGLGSRGLGQRRLRGFTDRLGQGARVDVWSGQDVLVPTL